MVNGKWSEDPNTVKGEMVRFYKAIFDERRGERPNFVSKFVSRLTEEEAVRLEPWRHHLVNRRYGKQ